MSNNLILIPIFIICAEILIYIIASVKYKNRMIKIGELQVYSQVNTDDAITKALDSIIRECFDTYITMWFLPKVKPDAIISDEQEIVMKHDVADIVDRYISPTYLSKISTRYNINNINSIIADKICLIITAYVSDYNSNVKDTTSDSLRLVYKK